MMRLKSCEHRWVFTNTHENNKEVWVCTKCFKSVLKSICLDEKLTA